MSYDYERIHLLMQIAKEAQAYPSLKAITSAASAELDAIANPPLPAEEVAEGEGEGNEPPLGDAPNRRRV